MMRILSFVFTVIFFQAFSQIGPRTWQDHLGINTCNSVTRVGSTIYASYFNGVIRFDEKELAPQTLNKINGLSDIGVRLVRANPYNNKVLIIYDNCNIDVIDANKNLKNYPDIKLKALNGKKLINAVTFDKQFAYLSCGFGIVVFDMDKFETKETYIIGPDAGYLEVNELAFNDSLIFAATPDGMYSANRSKALINYKNWRLDTLNNMPQGYFGGVKNVGGTILTVYNPSHVDYANAGKDTLYIYSNTGWKKYPPMDSVGSFIRFLGPVYENYFSFADLTGLWVLNLADGKSTQHLESYKGEVDYSTLRDAYIGKEANGNVAHWTADARFGLNRFYFFWDNPDKITRNGMNKNTISNTDIFRGKVAVSPSYINNAGTGNYSREGINILKNGEWSYLKCFQDDGAIVNDVTSVLWDRLDTTVLWACSWYYGVIKYKNGKQVTPSYWSGNYPMPGILPGEPRCSGLSMDKSGNLWFANSDVKSYLSVIKRNGQYQNFGFESNRGFIRKTFVDKNNQIWILHERDAGITVYNHKNFNTPQLGVNYRILTNAVGSGRLQSNTVYAIAEDLDGKIWIGTGEGISVFYNPSAIFSGNDFDAQPIKIVQDGNVELLLGKEVVTSIKVDGANNKWCGTLSGGIYCFSPDGQRELYHFTKENSSLYSNTIVEINYDEVTGDLFFATDAGLQSYRGITLAGGETYSDVYAYPNPVKPNYTGSVLIRGLIDDSVVKIADESGNMVWEAKSTGGQIEWPVTTFANNRVSSGVYIVYAATTTGELKALTKVLVVN
ncbi:hypothetical protein CNR22_10645 [Sphingobacteriaceae bacterium]|nr:hypothetical protein CNR22_10645 [Sphingobacteriaceae bacterium]